MSQMTSSRPSGRVETGEPADRTLHELVAAAASGHGSRTALVDGPTGRSVDHQELDRRIGRIAAWLEGEGVGPGDRVATWAPNLPPVAAVTLAVLRRGAAVVPLGPALTEAEVGGLLAGAEVSVVVTVPDLVEAASRLGVRRVVALGEAPGVTTLADLLATAGEATHVDVAPDAVAFVCASSGTTGTPKGVVLTHRQLVAAVDQLTEAMAFAERDVTLALAPWSHVLGLTAALLVPLAVGATVVTVATFDPVALAELTERYGVTYLAIPPPVVPALVAAASAGRDLSALELVGVGGAALRPELQEALARALPGCSVGQGWGLTETCGALCVPRRPGGATPGTVGLPMSRTEVRAVHPETGESLPLGSEGELVARGPQLMAGYLDRPEETAATLTPDGWLRTGDLGRVLPSGEVVVTGRLKELIKVNAEQVAPAEVEAVLCSHPGVVDAGVVGRPDDRAGEVPVAYVVTDGHVDLDALRSTLAARLAPYKRPRTIEVVDQLPRTPSGKLLRRALVAGR